MTINTNKSYTATIETKYGNLVLELFAKDAPITVNNFVFLAREGFYDRLTFHRVVREPVDFVVQGGDPLGTGYGNPGYRIPDEITSHKHVAGSLAMANSGPHTNSAGSQFYITYGPEPGLDGGYAVFGQLKEGFDVLNKIKQGDVMTKVRIDEK